MASKVIEVAVGNGSALGGGEQIFSYPTHHMRYIQALAQEDAALDAEDILTQAEEANALDPVG